MATPPPSSAEIISRLKQVLEFEKIAKVFYVDNTINNTGYDLERIISTIREDVSELLKNAAFKNFFETDVNFSVEDETVIFNEIEQVIRAHDESHDELFAFLFPNEPLVKDDVSDELRDLFGDVNFEALHPKGAMTSITNYFSDHTEGNVLFLFDFDFGEGMATEAIRNGGELILKVCSDFSGKQGNMIFAIITHLVSQGEEIERRPEFITGDLASLKPVPFLLSKTRKTDQLLLADGIKKTLLNKLVEKIKDQTISVLEEAFTKTRGLINTLDTYEFEHIIVKSSLLEGVWMGKTLRRLSTVLFENAIGSSMIEKEYSANVNPIFEDVIQYSLIHLLSRTENKPYNNREFLRYKELYTTGEDLNKLYEPVANGDIFEVTLNTARGSASTDYILVAQDCDIILRSEGTRNRSQRFFSLLPVNAVNKTELGQSVIKFAEKSKEMNHFMASKFVLPYYTSTDFEKIGLVNFNNELVVYIDVLDLVSINNTGEAKYDKDFQYPVSQFSHSLRNRYEELIKVCKKFNKDITGIESGMGSINDAVKDKIRSKFIKKMSPISEDKGNKNPHEGDGKFNFGIRRKSRLRKEYSSTLLMKYTQYISRAALDHDFASE